MEAVLLAITAASVLVAVGSVVWARRQVAGARRELMNVRRRANAPLIEGTVKAALGAMARVRDEGLGGALRGSIEELAGWAEEERPDLRPVAADDGTVTILFSDIEDSTALNEELGDRAWLRVLGAHDSIVRSRVDANGGQIVKSQGDGFMVAFGEPDEAVRCAIETQRRITAGGRRLRKNPIRVRIGIHAGEAVARDGDFFGRNVALAARVASNAEGGQILVSEAVAERAEDLELAAPREIELKGLGHHTLYEVAW